MTISAEERQAIVDEAVEKALLLLPQVFANLIEEHRNKVKLNQEFYKDHPEFKPHTEVVAQILESMEQEEGALDHKKLLEDAVPKIKERLRNLEKVDFKVNRLADRKI